MNLSLSLRWFTFANVVARVRWAKANNIMRRLRRLVRTVECVALLATCLAATSCGARRELHSEDFAAVSNNDAGALPPACVAGPPVVVIGVADTPNTNVIAVDDDDVYFVTDDGSSFLLSAAPKRGGGSANVIATLDAIDALAVDSDSLYVLSSTNGISRIDKATGATTTITHSYVTSIALDDTAIYFTTFASVMRAPKTGGPATTVVSGAQGKLVRDLSVVGDSLYWLSDASDVFVAAKDGSSARVLVHAGQLDDCMVDGTFAYGWQRDLNGTALLASPIASGAQTVLVDGAETAAPVYAGGGVAGAGVILLDRLRGSRERSRRGARAAQNGGRHGCHDGGVERCTRGRRSSASTRSRPTWRSHRCGCSSTRRHESPP